MLPLELLCDFDVICALLFIKLFFSIKSHLRVVCLKYFCNLYCFYIERSNGPTHFNHMETKSNIRINQISDLDKLRNFPMSLKQANTKIILNLSQFSSKDNAFWQKKLNRHAFACGCKEGAITSLIGITVILFSIYFLDIKLGSWPDFLSSSTFLLSSLFVALCIACGKISAILYSRWRFKKIINTLMKIYSIN